MCCRRGSEVQGGRQSQAQVGWRFGRCFGHHQNVGRGKLLQVGTPRQEENQCVGSHRFAIVRQEGPTADGSAVDVVVQTGGVEPLHTGQGEFTKTSFFNCEGIRMQWQIDGALESFFFRQRLSQVLSASRRVASSAECRRRISSD